MQPDNLDALFNQGRAHAFRGDWAAAAAVFGDLLERRPENFPTIYQLGMVRYFQGDYAGAVRYQLQAVRRDPHSGAIGRQLELFQRALKKQRDEAADAG